MLTVLSSRLEPPVLPHAVMENTIAAANTTETILVNFFIVNPPYNLFLSFPTMKEPETDVISALNGADRKTLDKVFLEERISYHNGSYYYDNR